MEYKVARMVVMQKAMAKPQGGRASCQNLAKGGRWHLDLQ